MRSVRIRSKIWLEVDGEPLLGEGRARLLRAIREQGSLNAAAGALGLSYRKAWSQLRQMEQSAPFSLVERVKGGRGGGSTQLTSEAEELLERYASVRQEIDTVITNALDEEITR
jgi:molybdate transport system regulatory protein